MKWSVVSPLKIAVVDDHLLIQMALKVRLSREADFNVVGMYSNGPDMLAGLKETPVDLLVLDYLLGDRELDGLALLRIIRKRHPRMFILISSSAERPALVSLTLQSGANGFFGKTQEVDELVRAIRVVAAGGTYLSPMMAYELARLPEGHVPALETEMTGGAVLVNNSLLSPKEREVLRCCLEGMGVSEIALKFSRSMKTISGQKQAAFRKLGVRSDTELFKIQRNLDDL